MFSASNHFGNQLPTSPPNNPSKSKRKLDINYINKNKYNMPSKKRITRVRFTDPSRTANQPSAASDKSRAANQPSSNTTRAASPTRILTPTSPALSSDVSSPQTPSPQIPTFYYIVNKIFSKSLIASLSSRDAVLKEVHDFSSPIMNADKKPP